MVKKTFLFVFLSTILFALCQPKLSQPEAKTPILSTLQNQTSAKTSILPTQQNRVATKSPVMATPQKKAAPTIIVRKFDSQAADSVVIDYQVTSAQTPALYGTNGWWSDQDANIWQERQSTLGLRIVRIPAMQSVFEPVNDDADPQHIHKDGFLFQHPIPVGDRTVTLEKWLTTLKNQNIQVMLNIPYLAGWNSRNGENGRDSTYPPKSMAEYKEYVTALLRFAIEDVGYSPQSVILEPVNEPDLRCDQDPVVNCFWKNWNEADLLEVLTTARQAANEVSPQIKVVGVSQCCGTQLIDHLVSDHNGLQLLDGFTYHRYVSGLNFQEGIDWGKHLLAYGKPVFINEYGSSKVWGIGKDGALWHANVLPQLFAAGIQPLQFPISHYPGAPAGYEDLGLFKDWRDNWQIKPIYWVYANFFNHFGNGSIHPVKTSVQTPIYAVSRNEGTNPVMAIWITVLEDGKQQALSFTIKNFPIEPVKIAIFDNLSENTPSQTQAIENQPITFSFQPLPRSCYTILIYGSTNSFIPMVQQ